MLGDPEKVTVNAILVELGQMDLLVRDGFYQNIHRFHAHGYSGSECM